ncbi:MAG: PQQ-binding-like beta-propeller repeat protein [Polyangiales bacterium]
MAELKCARRAPTAAGALLLGLLTGCATTPHPGRSCKRDSDCPPAATCAQGRCRHTGDKRAGRSNGKHALAAPSTGPGRHVETKLRGPAHPPRLRWRMPLGSPITALSWRDERTLLISTAGGTLTAVDTRRKRVLWQHGSGHARSAAQRWGKQILSSDAGGALWSLDLDGREQWWRLLAAGSTAPPLLLPAQARIFIPAFGLEARDRRGKRQWRQALASQLGGAPTWHPEGFVLTGDHHGRLHAFDPSSGRRRWQVQARAAIHSRVAVTPAGDIITGDILGWVRSFSAAGEARWQMKSGGRIESGPVVTPEGSILVATTAGTLLCLESAGTLRWRRQTGGALYAAPTVDRDGVSYIAGDDHLLSAIAADGTLRWQRNVRAPVQTELRLATTGTLWLGTAAGVLQAWR